MWRSRSKLTLAPLMIATQRRLPPRRAGSRPDSTHFLRPATARAPAGSATERASSNTSLTAPQISSVVAVTTSSTHSRAILNGSRPICATDTPSAKRSRVSSGRRTRRPAASAACRQAEPSASTPITRVAGRRYLM